MATKYIRVLLVEDSEADAEWIRRVFASSNSISIEVHRAPSLLDALRALRLTAYDAIVLDLGLPDSSALHTVLRVRSQCPDLPIVVMSGNDDSQFALDAISAGAQDYIVKTPESAQQLVRALRFALARNRQMVALRNSLLRDPLTGLLTEAGFTAICDEYLSQVDYARRKPRLFVFDLPAFDNELPLEADSLLLDAGDVLTRSFQPSDVYGQLKVGRFAVMTKNTDALPDSDLLARVEAALEDHNRKPGSRYMSFAVRTADCGALGLRSSAELIEAALATQTSDYP